MLKDKISEKDLENVSGGADGEPECVGCGACVDVCPMQAITMEGDKAYRDKDDCIYCDACIKECPLNIHPEFR